LIRFEIACKNHRRFFLKKSSGGNEHFYTSLEQDHGGELLTPAEVLGLFSFLMVLGGTMSGAGTKLKKVGDRSNPP
jgi:hypothetical protein